MTPKTLVFFHPDLGIGGAERLIVDAAVGLQDQGHRVVIFTSRCDADHCFEECRDGTLDVRVRANKPLPTSILSRLSILCAIARQMQLVLHVTATGELASLNPQAFIVDQLSAALPLLRSLHGRTPILFYCHFPDLLLARGRSSLIKRIYRLPFDKLEEWTTASAHVVAVNSCFTRDVVSATWPTLSSIIGLNVVYPCVDTHPPPQQKNGYEPSPPRPPHPQHQSLRA
ncbi:alpha-1,3-mannosyltransferase alg-2 [Ophiocordyceps camponoti-floridani]|uniref:Alpha-1,3/1,6-mannosyltransferase ALG2 n=1 Tax=Ophiocordyceps camponoti-floridani TaxID=2030778 RepID=A0A8H4Q983_9HYPO|nr:alpha-1,3-mannosyltransferase alg-2 [Ophiocordyceps camponoti-floridani]